MAWQTLTYKLTSSAPLIMHNGQTADPLNKWSKSLKQISSKRMKTDADYEEMARIEFMAGLYLGKDGPVVPANLIDALILSTKDHGQRMSFGRMKIFALALSFV
jgi:hypothetical protein